MTTAVAILAKNSAAAVKNPAANNAAIAVLSPLGAENNLGIIPIQPLIACAPNRPPGEIVNGGLAKARHPSVFCPEG